MFLPIKSPIHDIIFLASFITIIITLIELYRHRDKWGYILAPLSYLVNVFAYNFFLHFHLMSVNFAEHWSGVVRLHALFLAVAYIIIESAYRNKKPD